MRAIVAAYHDRENARAAADELVASGREMVSVEIFEERVRRFVVGVLAGLGVPQERAELFAEVIRRGGVVLVACAPFGEAEHIAMALDRHQSLDIERAGQRWRRAGWTGYRPDAAPPTEEVRKREREQLQRESLGEGERTRAYVTERRVPAVEPEDRDSDIAEAPPREEPHSIP
jgi:hypothetical protein